MLLAAGFSMLKNFSGTFEKNYVSDICFLLVYGVLCVLLLKSFEIYGTVAEEALNGSIDFDEGTHSGVWHQHGIFLGGGELRRLLSPGVSGHLSGGVALSFSVLLPFIRVYVVTEFCSITFLRMKNSRILRNYWLE